jgi:hypothetical protein
LAQIRIFLLEGTTNIRYHSTRPNSANEYIHLRLQILLEFWPSSHLIMYVTANWASRLDKA